MPLNVPKSQRIQTPLQPHQAYKTRVPWGTNLASKGYLGGFITQPPSTCIKNKQNQGFQLVRCKGKGPRIGKHKTTSANTQNIEKPNVFEKGPSGAHKQIHDTQY